MVYESRSREPSPRCALSDGTLDRFSRQTDPLRSIRSPRAGSQGQPDLLVVSGLHRNRARRNDRPLRPVALPSRIGTVGIGDEGPFHKMRRYCVRWNNWTISADPSMWPSMAFSASARVASGPKSSFASSAKS